MKILGLVFAILLVSRSAEAALSDQHGFFLSLRGGLSDGTATYQNVSDALNGPAGELALGWRASWIKFGFLGGGEKLVLHGTASDVGPMLISEGGAFLRFFFVHSVFIEGSGGQAQAKLAVEATGHDLLATGTFYNIGSGIELALNDTFSVELGLKVRTILFPQKEFDNMRSLYYAAGFTVYFP